MSLPHLLGIRLATLPAAVPYLRVPPALVAAWVDRLGPRDGPRIGIVCSGSASNTRDRWRSVPARELAPLLDREDIAFHLLQTEIRAEDDAWLAGRRNVHRHAADLTDLCETAALATQMDGIVTVCSAMAHLAGALALPTSILLSVRPHWVWETDRARSPWYPTAALFRQTAEFAWAQVVAELATMLRQRFPVP
jgi:ADP-heptose:LPS heptosyltransferase